MLTSKHKKSSSKGDFEATKSRCSTHNKRDSALRQAVAYIFIQLVYRPFFLFGLACP
jgi:hypothetical protein